MKLVVSFNVTRRALTLGSRDGSTGWRAITFTPSTIEMIIQPRGSPFMHLLPGAFAREDAVGRTADTVEVGDQILDSFGTYYEVKAIKGWPIGDSLVYRDCDLAELPLWQASPGTATWSKSRPHDPRYNTKDFIDTYIRDAQLTKDNDSTQASWACIWANPSYPLAEEYRAASSPVQGLYVLDQANSTPLLSYDQVPRGYEERVPIHICTVDSTACTGTILQWKMEAELRYACEQNPTGSQRGLERRAVRDRDIGSMWLYDTEFTLNYRRNITT